MMRLGELCTSYQGEVNETVEKSRGALSKDENDGTLILRGSNVCLYAVRGASQGEDYYLREARFLEGKSPTSKAFHGRQRRVGFQRSSPQNNFRRIVATIIEPGNYCFDTVSYITESASQIPLPFLVGLLNSKLLDWYFRLGSTNSKVNEYQFNNLPCPVFAEKLSTRDLQIQEQALSALRDGNTTAAFHHLQPLLANPPFSLALQAAIIEAVNQITAIEQARGEISRSARSALASDAQPFQDFIDRLLFALAGLTETEAAELEERLAQMM